MTTSLTVARRFRGPTASANGGYICGLIAALDDGPRSVRLLAPPRLETPLRVVARDGGHALVDGGETVAEARPGDVGELVPPPAPTQRQAVAAASRYAGLKQHPAPECFVCGPARRTGDGLRIFCGRCDPGGFVAGPWVPDRSLGDDDDRVATAFVWAALDCPGYAAVAPDMRLMLLGELTARIDRRVRVGERCIVTGWHLGSRGRKHEAGTALYSADGALCALSRAVWIEPQARRIGDGGDR